MIATKVFGAILMIASAFPWILAESELYKMSLDKFSTSGFVIIYESR